MLEMPMYNDNDYTELCTEDNNIYILHRMYITI